MWKKYYFISINGEHINSLINYYLNKNIIRMNKRGEREIDGLRNELELNINKIKIKS